MPGQPPTTDFGHSTLTLHWAGSPAGFNPLSALSLASWYPLWFLFDQLVHVDKSGTVVAQLAERWEISDDGRRYTFHLRPGVRWHDGKPLTARDVAFTYTMLFDPRSQSRWRSLATLIQGTDVYPRRASTISGIQALGEGVIAFQLRSPHAGFLATIGFPIVPEHLLGVVPPEGNFDETDFAQAPVGTGPFKFVRHVPGQLAELVANPGYWGGRPRLDGLILRQLSDEAALDAVERGLVDVMLIDAMDVDRLRKRPDISVRPVRTSEYRILMANLQKPTLRDRRLREAILIAIDRQAILDEVFHGMGEVVNSVLTMPPWAVNHDLDGAYPYDPGRARALLRDAGFASGLRMRVLTGPGAIPARLDSPFLRAIQRYLAEVGIELAVDVKDVPEYVADYQAGDFELFTCCGTSGPDPDFTSIYFHSAHWPPKGSNGARYANPEIDRLLEQGRASTDLASRARIYHEYAARLSEDLPWLVLWHEDRILAINAGVEGDFENLAMAWVPGTLPESRKWSKRPSP